MWEYKVPECLNHEDEWLDAMPANEQPNGKLALKSNKLMPWILALAEFYTKFKYRTGKLNI